MEIKVLESSNKRLKIELVGEDHTLANVIRKELWEDKHIEAAGYSIEHPLVSNPILLVETNGKEDPKKVLLNAVENLKKKNKEILDEFSKK